MTYERYIPPHLKRSQLAAVVGLVSDTHMPQRRRALPANLGDVLGGVDLLLHAGDVGELLVLDQLSIIAPTIAVHGNDDSEDAQRELPFQQIVSIAGQRILLWHSHFPNWHDEMDSRKDDALLPKFQRSIDHAKRAGAKIVVFGHWHIPLVYQCNGIMLANPGALASGNEFTRQLRNTVALLFIEKGGSAHIVHIDLAAPDAPYEPHIEWNAGFMVAAKQFSRSIVSPDLRPLVAYLRANFTMPEIVTMRPLVAAKAMPIWEQDGGELTISDVIDALVNTTELPADLHQRVRNALHSWQNSS